MQKDKILILADDTALREMFCTFLSGKGYTVLPAGDCSTGHRIWTSQRPDAAVLDYTLPDGNSLDLLSRWKVTDPHIPVIILTGNGSIDKAVQAIKLGAEQFVTKPADLTALHLMLERALENERNRRSRLVASERQKRLQMNPFLGTNAAIRELAEVAQKLVRTDSSILIMGETGTGKGVLARWLHDNSTRSSESFVELNCAGLSRELLESELFGHEKGAFTGAVQSKLGLLEMGHRGTVFLDEIGDMELQIQPRLLKVIEDKKFRRLGDVRDRLVDVRFLSGTHHNLAQAVGEKKFRSDLYFRINTISLSVPPLRARAEDIPLLTEWILCRLCEAFGKKGIEVTPAAMAMLESYSWPGNIRELRNVLERAVLLSEGQPISPKQLNFIPAQAASSGTASHKTMNDVERQHIHDVLCQNNWNVRETAKALGIPRSSLYTKLKEYGITRAVDAPEGKPASASPWRAENHSSSSDIPDAIACMPNRTECGG
jgi:DNA-binding NtrC family response regulator